MVILTLVNRNNRYTLIDGYYLKIINLLNKIKNFIVYNYYVEINFIYYYEYILFKNYYIKYTYVLNNLNFIQYFNYSDEKHRDDGPAYIQYYASGKIYNKKYYLNDKYYSYEDYLLEIEKLV